MTWSRILLASICLGALPNTAVAQWFGEQNAGYQQPSIRGQSSLKKIEQIEEMGPSRQRAVNLARSTVIRLNGGLSSYRPDKCMYSSSAEGCLKSADRNGFLFIINGGNPGWQELGYRPNRTSKILIAPDGRSVSRIYYNGSFRSNLR